MKVVRKDLPVIHALVESHYIGGKSDTLLNRTGDLISKGSFKFGFSGSGSGLVDGKNDPNYRAFDLPSLYHILDAAMKLLYSVFLGDTKQISLDELLQHWGGLKDTPSRMKNADWTYDYSDDFRVWERGSNEIKNLIKDIEKYDSPAEKALLQSLWSTYVPENTVRMPEFLSLKTYDMNNEDFEFNQRQFKAVGMLDHFNSDVIEKMKQGEPRIRHEISPTIDGEQVRGAVYLNKAKEGNRYFLNKFDMEKTRQNGTTVKQTFYNNNRPKAGEENTNQRPQQQWTQKRAYNFLSGRPVHDKNNDEWNKINFNKKLKNGNYATDRFDKNYGFDLRKTMGGYSFADAGDKERMDQIAEGLQRGNLQKAKMVSNDGKKEDYHVSLSIRTSSMKVYDKDKKEVSLEQQVEKGLITKELAEQLKMLYGKKQDQKPENKIDGAVAPDGLSQQSEKKQQQGQSQKESIKQGNGLNGKEEQAAPRQKHSHKH